MVSMGQVLRVSTDDHVSRITLANPEHRNVLTKQLSDQLADAVGAALAGGARALVLDAEPPVFCSGGSLDSLTSGEHPLSAMYAGVEALSSADVPTIALVTGPAVGAGVNLALACDVIVAGESARFDPRFLDVGIHPGGGHLWRLTERVGPQGAAALSLLGDTLTGPEAAARGLAWRCVPDAEGLDLALSFARRAAGRSPELVQRTKRTLRESRPLTDPVAASALELEAQEWSVRQPHFARTVERIRTQLRARRR